MHEIAIRLEDVAVSYRHGLALQGISLKVASGEFVGIVGPNGAGKTTLLTLINGLARPGAGTCVVLGKNTQMGSNRLLRKRIGYVPQAETTDPRMPLSVSDEVMLGRYGVLGFLRGPGKRDCDIVENALDLVGMKPLANRPIGYLSGGEHQRVAIARCLAQQPELFLLDEPTASLDWKAQSEILNIVRRIHREQRMTTLFVTHDLDALPHACDRVLMMKGGSIVGDGPPDIVSTRSLSELFDLPEDVVRERRPHVHRETISP